MRKGIVKKIIQHELLIVILIILLPVRIFAAVGFVSTVDSDGGGAPLLPLTAVAIPTSAILVTPAGISSTPTIMAAAGG